MPVYSADLDSLAARSIYAQLGLRTETVSIREAPQLDSSALVIAVFEETPERVVLDWQRAIRNGASSLLGIRISAGDAVIGPVIRAGASGCFRCWRVRAFAGRANAAHFADHAVHSAAGAHNDPWFNPTLSTATGLLVSARIARLLEKHPEAADRRNIQIFSFRTLLTRSCRLTPVPECTECSVLPADVPQLAAVRLRPDVPVAAEDRATDPRMLLQNITPALVGECGSVRGASNAWVFRPGAVAIANVHLHANANAEPCTGYSSRYSTARAIAVLEALERYAGAMPRNRKITVQGTYRSLQAVAAHPGWFGLYTGEQYARHPASIRPFHDDLQLPFAWGYSLSARRPLLVPRDLAFYSPLGRPQAPPIAIEGSSGCSVGTSPEEAILHGLFEVIERDAFLLAWYSAAVGKPTDIESSADLEVRCRNRNLVTLGFETAMVDITSEFGIPAVLAVARARKRHLPRHVCAAAAHLNSRHAIRRAMRELHSAAHRMIIEMQSAQTMERMAWLAEDPARVATMQDHSLCYCSEQADVHFDFLGSAFEGTRALVCAGKPTHSGNVGRQLQAVLETVFAKAGDVIVVDQTTPEQKECGLYTFKSLIPGTFAITWGAGLSRTQFSNGDQQPNWLPRSRGGKIVRLLPHPFP